MAGHAISLRRAAAPTVAEPPLPILNLFENVPGVSTYYTWQGERIHYRMMGNGPALLLVHTPDIGSCCLEWRRNMEALAERFTVYAVDLPGFGLSEAHPGQYTGELYVRFLLDFLREVSGPGTRAIGSVLGASYLVHAADRWPSLIDRLLLVAPAGLSAFRPRPLAGLSFRVLGLPGVGAAVWSNVTSRYSILEHLQSDVYSNEEWAGPSAVDTRYALCHRPHATTVERCRMAGLFNMDIRPVVPRLTQPVLVAWGRNAARPPVSDAEIFHELCPGAKVAIFERSALAPHEEEAPRFNPVAATFMEIERVPQAA